MSQSSLSTYLESPRRPLDMLLAEDRCPVSQRLHSKRDTKHGWLPLFRPGPDRQEGGACRPLVELLAVPEGDAVAQRAAAFGVAESSQGKHL